MIGVPLMPPGLELRAQAVTIRRDGWGIPHIEAKRDADVVFGLMFAQAEDNYDQLQRDTAYAVGRAAELDGDRGLGNDVRFRVLRIERLAKARLARADRGLRALAQGYADGLNFYLQKHPCLKPRIGHYEPWFFLANVDLPGNVDGVPTTRAEAEPFRDAGSNAWAIAPSRTNSGRATLFLNPHVGLFGPGQRYECNLKSAEGWDFSGFCILGCPVPHAGYNRHLGWTHTNTRADSSDAYRLTLAGTGYRYGKGIRPFERWTETIPVREGDRIVPRTVPLERSHYGPVVRRGAETISFRLPIERWMEFWPQKLRMTKAKDLVEFKRALAIGGLTYSNTTYADDQGNIAFWYGNTVPRRDAQFDWSRPVDGSDPRTEWKGYFRPEELPHVINPASGFVQNCNSAPWETTVGADNPRPASYPPYIMRDVDTARAANSRRILGGDHRFTYAELSQRAFDTQVLTAKERVPKILAAVGDASAPLAALAAWDGLSTVDSVAATLYFETELRASVDPRRGLTEDPAALREAFQSSIDALTRRFGTWQVPWGRVNRLQRVRPFGTAVPSWPVAGAPSAFGQIFAFTGSIVDGVHYGTGGNTYVGLVEFGLRPKASVVCGFGQSADPNSPHFTDQAPFYAAGQFRPAASGPEHIYHPGD